MSFKPLPKKNEMKVSSSTLKKEMNSNMNSNMNNNMNNTNMNNNTNNNMTNNQQNMNPNSNQSMQQNKQLDIDGDINNYISILQSKIISYETDLISKDIELSTYSSINNILNTKFPDLQSIVDTLIAKDKKLQDVKNEKVLLMLQEKDNEINSLKNKIDVSNQELNNLQNSIQPYEQILNDNNNKLYNLENELNKLYNENKLLKEHLDNALIELKDNKLQLELSQTKSLKYDQDKIIMEDEIKTLHDELREKSRKIASFEKDIETLKSLNTISKPNFIRLNDKESSENQTHIDNLNEQLQSALKDSFNSRQKLEECETQLLNMKNELKILKLARGSDNTLDVIYGRVSALENQLSHSEQQLFEMKKIYDEELELLKTRLIQNSNSLKSNKVNVLNKKEKDENLLVTKVTALETSLASLQMDNKYLLNENKILKQANVDFAQNLFEYDKLFGRKDQTPSYFKNFDETNKKKVTFNIPGDDDRKDSISDFQMDSQYHDKISELSKHLSNRDKFIKELEAKNLELESKVKSIYSLYDASVESNTKLDKNIHSIHKSNKSNPVNFSTSSHTGKEFSKLQAKYQQCSLREEHLNKRVRDLESLLSKQSSIDQNDMIAAVSGLEKIVKDSSIAGLVDIKDERAELSLIESHTKLVNLLSELLSTKEVELAKCRKNIKQLMSESENLKLVSSTLKVELELANSSYLSRLEVLNRELAIKDDKHVTSDKFNHDDDQISSLFARINSLENLLQIEKSDNLALKTSLNNLSNHKCYLSDDSLSQVDKDSVLVKLSEQNELFSKQIKSMQNSILYNVEGKINNLASVDGKYSSIPTSEYVNLLIDTENFKLSCGKQMNEIEALKKEINNLKTREVELHNELSSKIFNHQSELSNIKLEYMAKLSAQRDEITVLSQKVEILNSNTINNTSHSSSNKVELSPDNLLLSAELQNLSDKFSQLELTLFERDSQIHALVETIEALQNPSFDVDEDLRQKTVLLQSQLKSSEIIQSTLQQSLDLLVKQYDNQLLLNSSLIKEIQLKKKIDGEKNYSKKIDILENTKSELQRQLLNRNNEIISLESHVAILEVKLSQSSELTLNLQNEIQRIKTDYFLEISKQSVEAEKAVNLNFESPQSDANLELNLRQYLENSPSRAELSAKLSEVLSFSRKQSNESLYFFIDKLVENILKQDLIISSQNIEIKYFRELKIRDSFTIKNLSSSLKFSKISLDYSEALCLKIGDLSMKKVNDLFKNKNNISIISNSSIVEMSQLLTDYSIELNSLKSQLHLSKEENLSILQQNVDLKRKLSDNVQQNLQFIVADISKPIIIREIDKIEISEYIRSECPSETHDTVPSKTYFTSISQFSEQIAILKLSEKHLLEQLTIRSKKLQNILIEVMELKHSTRSNCVPSSCTIPNISHDSLKNLDILLNRLNIIIETDVNFSFNVNEQLAENFGKLKHDFENFKNSVQIENSLLVSKLVKNLEDETIAMKEDYCKKIANLDNNVFKDSSIVPNSAQNLQLKELESMHSSSLKILHNVQLQLYNSTIEVNRLQFALNESGHKLNVKDEQIKKLDNNFNCLVAEWEFKHETLPLTLLKFMMASIIAESDTWCRYQSQIHSEISLRNLLLARDDRIVELRNFCNVLKSCNCHCTCKKTDINLNLVKSELSISEETSPEIAFDIKNIPELQNLLVESIVTLKSFKLQSLTALENLRERAPSTNELRNLLNKITRKQDREIELYKKVKELTISEKSVKDSLKQVSIVFNSKSHDPPHQSIEPIVSNVTPATPDPITALLSQNYSTSNIDTNLYIVELKSQLHALDADYQALKKEKLLLDSFAKEIGWNSNLDPKTKNNFEKIEFSNIEIDSLKSKISSLQSDLNAVNQELENVNLNYGLLNKSSTDNIVLSHRFYIILFKACLKNENEHLKKLVLNFEIDDVENFLISNNLKNTVDEEIIQLKEKISAIKSELNVNLERFKEKLRKEDLGLTELDLRDELIEEHDLYLSSKLKNVSLQSDIHLLKLMVVKLTQKYESEATIMHEEFNKKLQKLTETCNLSEADRINLVQKNLTLTDNLNNISNLKIELERENVVLKDKILDSSKKIDKIENQFKLDKEYKTDLQQLCSNLELKLNGLSSQLLERENQCQILELEKKNLSNKNLNLSEFFKNDIFSCEEKLSKKENQLLNQADIIHTLQIELDNFKARSNSEINELNSLLRLERESLRLEKAKLFDIENDYKRKTQDLQSKLKVERENDFYSEKSLNLSLITSNFEETIRKQAERYSQLVNEFQKILHSRFAAVYDKHLEFLKSTGQFNFDNLGKNPSFIELMQYKALCEVLKLEVDNLNAKYSTFSNKLDSSLPCFSSINSNTTSLLESIGKFDTLDSKNNEFNSLLIKCSSMDVKIQILEKEILMAKENNQSNKEEISDSKSELSKVQNENRVLMNQLKCIKNNIKEVDDSKSEAIKSVKSQFEELTEKFNQANDSLNTLKKSNRILKDEVARKTQLLQHMKVQLENANETLSYLEPQLKDKDSHIIKLQKQLAIKDKILLENKEKIQSLNECYSDEDNAKKALNIKMKHLYAELSRKDLWISQLKQQCHDLELNNRIAEVKVNELSFNKEEDHIQTLKAALNRSDCERKDAYNSSLKASMAKLHEEIVAKDNLIITNEQMAENKIKLLKQKERNLIGEIKDTSQFESFSIRLKQFIKWFCFKVLYTMNNLENITTIENTIDSTTLSNIDEAVKAKDPLLSQFSAEELSSFLGTASSKIAKSFILDGSKNLDADFDEIDDTFILNNSSEFSNSIKIELEQIIIDSLDSNSFNSLMHRVVKLIEILIKYASKVSSIETVQLNNALTKYELVIKSIKLKLIEQQNLYEKEIDTYRKKCHNLEMQQQLQFKY